MSRSRAADGGIVAQQSPADRWIGRVAAGTVAGLASLAAAISYSHMRQLAQQHGQAGWHAHAFPLSVDGLELVASLVLLADRRHGRRPGWLPWAALITGTAGSLAANIATAHPDPVSRLIAGWPALALLISVKLLSSIFEHREPAEDPAAVRAEPPALPGHDDDGSHPQATSRPPAAVPARKPATARAPARQATRAEPCALLTPAQPPAASRLDPGAAVLLSAARAARDELERDGLPLTRDALAARMRQRGHPIRNARLTPLLQLLRAEEEDPWPPPPAPDSSKTTGQPFDSHRNRHAA